MKIEVKRTLKKTLFAVGLGLILIVITLPVHEFGHWIVAMIDGAQIYRVVWFPYFNGTHFINAEITVNEFSFSSIHLLIFCKLAGFLILFIPSILFFTYFFRRSNEWWHAAYILMMGSIITADHDFLDIGRTLNSAQLAIGLYITSYVVTFGICVPWYAPKLYNLRKLSREKNVQEAEKSKISFWSIMKMNKLDRKVCNIIADRTLTLAGFTLTALTFIIGFYRENLTTASTLITPLLLAMFLFFLGSQLAHEAEYFWQIFFADICQYVGVITLMVSFYNFINENLKDIIVTLLPLFLAGILVAYLVRGAWRIYKFYKKFKSQKETNRAV